MDELLQLARPQWRSALPPLWIGDGRVRIGDHVVLDRMAPAHVAWILRLDGLRTSRQVLRELPIEPDDAARIVRALLAAGALQDAARIPAPLRWLASSAREDAVARYECAVDAYRDWTVAVRAVELRDQLRVWVAAPAMVRDLLHEAIAAAGLSLGRTEESSDAVILADAPHPDVPRALDDTAHRRPHLHMGIHGARAVIGPMVVPGITSCLRCDQLHRRDADPGWPLVAVQWAQQPASRADPLLARLAASHAVAVVRHFADRADHHEEWARQAWQLTLPGAALTVLPRPEHPLCGCRWTSA